VKWHRRATGSFQTGVAIMVGLLVSIPLLAGAAAGGLMSSFGFDDGAGMVAASSPQPVPVATDPLPPGVPDLSWPWGQCTWYVAQHRHVTWGGDAADWLRNAQAEEVATASVPTVGAIVVYRRGWPYDPVDGHVALVIAVASRSYQVGEMNYVGLGRVDERTVPWPDPAAEGFIP